MAEKKETDEAYLVRYYNQIPIGERADFLLVIRVVLGGSDVRWLKRFAAWKEADVKRRLHPHESDKLKRLTDNGHWREILHKIHALVK